MAMIKCPECGEEISDKAKKCIHCGKVLIEGDSTSEIKCSECGTLLFEKDEICPNCGCPVKNEEKPQQVEVSSIKVGKKTKGIILGIVLILLVFAVGRTGYKVYTYNAYIDNLNQVKDLMLLGGSDAESLCNLTLKVWGNAISKESDSETDEYTRDKYSWNDFNTALAKLYADSSTKSKVSDIKSNQSVVKILIKKLQEPPKELDKCYNTVSDLYESYITLTDLAVSPSGNYTGYGTNKSNAVSGFMSAYEKLDNQIPEK
jgi:transcription initiation factor TFIIIB Brf1 subunit/transcription initiation factor TFIIB